MTSQILEYAESGRLVEGPRAAKDDQKGAIALVVVAALVLGAGLALTTSGALGSGDDTTTLVAIMCTLGALAILVPGIRLLRTTPAGKPVKVRPAAVLPPELVRQGNWIHRDGAWMRVEHVGRDGGGRIHALLSSGDVVELSTPVTIGGDEFRPSHDPVESLRP
ncbi:MAG: hypothetical protein R8F63_18430 [Acidimicrobiales bacterium]|nr:hypothetical protein [Acidimicrobiales bacterium]